MDYIRAVIYCRCSTEEESQINALQNQVQESEACVLAQRWRLVDRYVESKSGTTTKGRDEYIRLYEDLLSDRFDVIVIKSQDRLMRNVKDWYLFLDRMQCYGKRLYIYLEHKFYTADDSLITGIKAILAEDYSRELSKKINNAHRNRQKNGGKAMLTSRTFCYRKLPDGSVAVVEEEAEIVREIFSYCIAGYGSRTIANIYNNQGYRKKTGTAFCSNSVRRIIRNPLYMGTQVMNRRHYDFETKREIRLPPEEWIYGTGQVPAIVTAEVWEQANAVMTARAEKYCRAGSDSERGNGARDGNNPENGSCACDGNNPESGNDVWAGSGIGSGGSGRYALSGKLICANCGQPYYRVQRHSYQDHGKMVAEWKCSTYLSRGRKKLGCRDQIRRIEKHFREGCDNVHLDEKVLFRVLEEVCRKYYYDLTTQDKGSIIEHAISLLRKALKEKKGGSALLRAESEEARLREQKERLLTKLLDGVISDQDYQKRNRLIEQKLEPFRMEKEEVARQGIEIRNLEQRIDKIRLWLGNGGLEKTTVGQMLQDIEKIVVHEWQLEIRFDPLKVLTLSAGKTDAVPVRQGVIASQDLSEGFTVWIDYPFPPETERGRYLDRRRILNVLKERPELTVKRVAEELGESPYMVRNRFEELISGGYIRFDGKGGHGVWEVLKELPDKEMSRKAGGL